MPPISKLDRSGSAPEPVFSFRIAAGAATPIYRQLVDQATIAIASGSLMAGVKMPSVRAVAEELLINPNTVARAYGDLVQAGVLETQPGRGVFVAAAAASSHRRYSDAERAERLRRAAAQFVQSVALLGFSKAELLHEVDLALDALGQDDAASPDLAEPADPPAAGEAIHVK